MTAVSIKIDKIFGILLQASSIVVATKKFREACNGFADLHSGVVEQSIYMDNECYFYVDSPTRTQAQSEIECRSDSHPILGQARLMTPRNPADVIRICNGMGKTDSKAYWMYIFQPTAHLYEYDTNYVYSIHGKVYQFPGEVAWGVVPYYKDPQPSLNHKLTAKNVRAPAIMRYKSFENLKLGDCLEACMRNPTCVSLAHNKKTEDCHLQWTHFNHTVQVPEPAYGYDWYQSNYQRD